MYRGPRVLFASTVIKNSTRGAYHAASRDVCRRASLQNVGNPIVGTRMRRRSSLFMLSSLTVPRPTEVRPTIKSPWRAKCIDQRSRRG